jgi:integrase
MGNGVTMATVKLTKRLIDETAPRKGARLILWDSEVVGLGLRVEESGRKTFILTYRTREGRQRKPALGKYGSDLTLQQARDMARQWLAEVKAGGDPSQGRQEARRSPTVAEVAERYLAERVRPHQKPSTIKHSESIFRRYVLPELGSVKVNAVGPADVERLHLLVGDEKRSMANDAVKLLSTMFKACEQWGLRPEHSNPCRHVKRFREYPKHRVLSGEELARLGESLSHFDARGPAQARAVAIIRLLVFTGARYGEIANLRWNEVDLDPKRPVLRLGDSKTGPKVIPLNTAAREILAVQKPGEPHAYVFPGRTTDRPCSTARWEWWNRVRERAGLPDVRLHDLRHTYAATGAASGLTLHQIGQLLGHRDPSTTARYSDMLVDPKIRAAETVGQVLQSAMSRCQNGDGPGRLPPAGTDEVNDGKHTSER